MLLQKFDDNILSLTLRNDFTKTKYPKFYEFYNKHCVSRTYHFHIFKCSEADCPWHEPIRFGKIANFGELAPSEIADDTVKYILSSDPSEKFLPTKFENPGKRTHGTPFTPTAQTAINVGKIVKSIHCLKSRVVYAKKKLSDVHKWSMKCMLNDFQYVCGTVFHDLPTDDKNKDSFVLGMIHCRENLTCESPMEIPYYSSKLFKNLCFYCVQERNLMPSNMEFYSQFTSCQPKTRAKVAKRKQVVASDVVKKKQKNISLRHNSIHLPFDSSASFVNIFSLIEKLMFLVLFMEIDHMILLFVFPCFTTKKELRFVNFFTNALFDMLVLP